LGGGDFRDQISLENPSIVQKVWDRMTSQKSRQSELSDVEIPMRNLIDIIIIIIFIRLKTQ